MSADPESSSAQVSGFTTALYLFDVAQEIDLGAVARLLGGDASAARLEDKSAGPARVQYVQPPVVVDGRALGVPDIDTFRVKVKFFDYGVISLTLTRPFGYEWAQLVAEGQSLIESEPLEAQAAAACRQIVGRVHSALTGVRHTYLSEDYLVFVVTSSRGETTADEVMRGHGREIAQLVRGERQPLSEDEQGVVLRNRLSYLADDLVVPAWNAAFIFDSEASAWAAIEILEFANSQLLELRYHDEALEAELTRLYAELQRAGRRGRFASRRQTKAALAVQELLIDVNELTDRMENAVKFVGDPYAARLFGLLADRLGLSRWKASVEDKLETLDDIRRFAVEQANMAQANVLELAILLILLLELGLFFAGIMT